MCSGEIWGGVLVLTADFERDLGVVTAGTESGWGLVSGTVMASGETRSENGLILCYLDLDANLGQG